MKGPYLISGPDLCKAPGLMWKLGKHSAAELFRHYVFMRVLYYESARKVWSDSGSKPSNILRVST